MKNALDISNPPTGNVLIFSDLDGTLLDHHSYSPDAARPALQALAERGWPLIFCSSKTFAEQLDLQRRLGLVAPFITENGSAVAVPNGHFAQMPTAAFEREGHLIFQLAHADVAALRTELAHFQRIKGFSDVPDEVLALATGLSGPALARARQRWFTETLVTPLGSAQVEMLSQKLSPKNWALSRGGRFHTVQSAQADKGRAMLWLADLFARNAPRPPVLAAIGDSPNDRPMLAAADFPFLVQRHDGTWSDVNLPGLAKIEGIGPAGFEAAVRWLLGES